MPELLEVRAAWAHYTARGVWCTPGCGAGSVPHHSGLPHHWRCATSLQVSQGQSIRQLVLGEWAVQVVARLPRVPLIRPAQPPEGGLKHEKET